MMVSDYFSDHLNGPNETVSVFKKVLMKLHHFYSIGTNQTAPISKFSFGPKYAPG